MLPETIYAPTQDGWRLALHHWPSDASAAVPRRRHPVMMVHGLAANRLNLDLDDRHSLARAARRRGFDVYVLELRGAGLSRAPGGRDRSRFQWGFADYSDRDMPGAIAKVLERSGASQFHGLGHSMGGMLMYCLGSRRDERLRSITAIGVPLTGELQLAPRERRLLAIATRFSPENVLRTVPLRRLMGAAGRFIPLSSRLVDGLLLNASNTDREVIGRLAREAIDDIPLHLLMELTRRIQGKNGDKGPYAYEASLDRIDVPVLVIGGSCDRLATPASVAAAARRLASPDVRFREMGAAHGDGADYGHIDLLVGRNAPDEVYPLILDFLEEVD